MPTDIASEFDLGPLSWVQGEIDQALSRGLESLNTWRAQPDDLSLLKHARTHVHQAAGAIQMVGLDAVVAYTDEIERQLGKLEEASPEARIAIGQAVDRRAGNCRIFLDELVAGAPPVPLKLFPEYETMQRLRGIRAASPTDLFYPDLSTRAPNLETSQVIAKEKRQSYMIKQRRMFQRGLLAWLRGRRRWREDHARRGRRHRERDRAGEPARVLVDDRGARRCVHGARPRTELRREAARGAHRSADSPRRRGIGEGRRPPAP